MIDHLLLAVHRHQGFDVPGPAWTRLGRSSRTSTRMTYQVSGGEFYDRTVPEQCFSSESDAIAAGYRASKR